MFTLQLLHASDLEAGLLAPGRMGNFAAIVDEDGTILDVIARDGALIGQADREIRLVTLNFLANARDGYPFPAFGENGLRPRPAWRADRRGPVR